MATGYVPASFCNTNASASGTNLFTVPAGHKYIIDQALALFAFGVGGPFAIHLEISDTAGANFRRVTVQFIENIAGASNIVVSFTDITYTANPPSGATADTPTNIRNMVLEAGQIMRVVHSGTGASVTISGIDYTI